MNKKQLMEDLEQILNENYDYTFVYSRDCTKIITRSYGRSEKNHK